MRFQLFSILLLLVLLISGCGGDSKSDSPKNVSKDLALTIDNISSLESGMSTTLSANFTSADGVIYSYNWVVSCSSDIDLGIQNFNLSSLDLNVPDLEDTLILTISLTVLGDDSNQETYSINIALEPNNSPPEIIIASEITTHSSAVTTLTAVTNDTEGHSISYSWSLLSSVTEAIDLSGLNTPTLSFVAPEVTSLLTLTFELVVTDELGAESKKSIIVNVFPDSPVIDMNVENFELYFTESLSVNPVIVSSPIESVSWEIIEGVGDLQMSSFNTAFTEITIGDVGHVTTAKLALTVTDIYAQSTTEYLSLDLLPVPDDDESYFTWPVNCLVGEDCGVGYADVDNTNLSYNCNEPGYLSHQGTDIYLTDDSGGWTLMDSGVDILAAQSGTVLFVLSDPNAYDRCGSSSDEDVTEEDLLYCEDPESALFAGDKENNTACTNTGNYGPNGEEGYYWCFSSPNLVAIKHGDSDTNPLVTIYEHIKTGSILVQQGDLVQRGQKIAEVGSTGNSTGPHLHFEVWQGFGNSVDPFYGSCGPNYDVQYWVLNEKPWLVEQAVDATTSTLFK